MDHTFEINLILDVIYDEEYKEFYFLANKRHGFIGFYLIKFSEDDPMNYEFVTMWAHKLDIDNANMYILRGLENGTRYKELVVGYKTIYINTYTLWVTDLGGESQERATL